MTAARPGRPRKAPDADPSPDQLRRLKFIERSAFWAGRVGRRAVANAFDVSLGHASKDFACYRRLAPRNLDYDPEEGCYRPSTAFRALFAPEPPEQLLEILGASVQLPIQERLRWLGFDAPAIRVGPLPMQMNLKTTATLFRALVSGTGLRLTYQSLELPLPALRLLQPTGFIHTGRRWLVRGWDADRQGFRDFAIARVLKATPVRSISTAPRDDAWHEMTTLEIEPGSDLSPSQAAVVAREHGMTKGHGGDWKLHYDVRLALVPYTLDFLGLRPGSVRQGDVPDVKLANYEELAVHDRRPVDRRV